MKKSLFLFSLLIVVIVSFVGGARFNQHSAGQNTFDTNERRILHYVDPMNPANTSKEPGIAPCGMPMEPVYSDEDTLGGSTPLGTLGSVRINEQKQQIIGVQIGEATRVTETSMIRALGRIVPDENKVYALVAATDGWMGKIHDSTTGSLVSKNQIMAKIKVYDYDFLPGNNATLQNLAIPDEEPCFSRTLQGQRAK